MICRTYPMGSIGVSSLSVIVRFSIGGSSSTVSSFRVRGPWRAFNAFCSSSSSESALINVLRNKANRSNLNRSERRLTDYLRTVENHRRMKRNYRPRNWKRCESFSVWTCLIESSSSVSVDDDVVPVALKPDRRVHSSSESDRAGFPSSLESLPELQIDITDEVNFGSPV